MTRAAARPGAFEREVRNLVAGGLLFLLFLAGLSLVVLRNTTAWAVEEKLGRLAAETRSVAEALARAEDAAPALASDARVAELLRRSGARLAVLFGADGARVSEAAFLPDAGAGLVRLDDAERPAPREARVKETLVDGRPAVAVALALGDGRVLRVLFDGAPLAAAHRNVSALSVVVPSAALVLVVLVVPFLKRLMRPIDALTETARGAGALVAGGSPGAEGAGRDEAERAVATFARTIAELRRRNAEIDAMRKSELAALSEMSAGIAHEFRNATATILGYLRLAESETEGEARRRQLGAARAEAEHVARVTGDFLLFARPEGVAAQPADVGALVEETVAEERVASPAARFDVEGTFGTAAVDAALLRRALVNLLRNAADAAVSGGAAGRVRVVGEGVSDGVLSFGVEDDGPGVPEADASKVFVPFFSTKESGAGVGLALVAKIVALHGGSVSVERSRRLGGARFVVRLTVAGPPSACPPAP